MQFLRTFRTPRAIRPWVQNMNDQIAAPSPTNTWASDPRPAAGSPELRLSYHGRGTDLFLLTLKNAVLTIITVGIYAVWARTARRRYLWKQVQVDGQPLAYLGTGKELFVGLLQVFGVVLAAVVVLAIAQRISETAGRVMMVATYLGVMALVPFLLYGARRYLLSRTRWRGIAFGMTRDASAFAKVWLKGLFLTYVTLGIYAPVFMNRSHAFLMNNTRYGNARFTYDGPDREAFKIGIVGLLLTLLTLGVYLPWYIAKLQRFRMAHTHFDRATGSLNVTGGLLMKLLLMNIFGTVLTLGIAAPWLTTMSLRRLLPQVKFVGAINYGAITAMPVSGDAASDAFAGVAGFELGV